MLAAVAGPGMVTSITAIGIFQIPLFVRITRGSANAIWAREFVLAARASGKGKFRITLEHVLPNILSILIVQATIQFALAILAEAALSYLGLGTQPPQPSWGRMLNDAQSLLFQSPSLAVYPGSCDRNRGAGTESLGRRAAGPVRSAAVAGAVMTDRTPLIEVDNLRVRLNTSRGPADAVRGVSFSLARGETLGLIGESGCGKSVTALALMGLLPESAVDQRQRPAGRAGTGRPGRGRLLQAARQPREHDLPGADDGAQSDAHRRPPGRRAAAPAQGLFRPRRRTREAIALLDRVGLPDAAKRVDAYPHQFSGGQRQRITIAMALACEPDLLIADEPTTALDVTIQGQILDLIADLVAERGMSMILISHDLGVIAENVQRMMVMYGGTVVENGDDRSAVRRASAIPTARACSARGRGSARRKVPGCKPFAGTVPELADLPSGCAFADRCDIAEERCRAIFPAAGHGQCRPHRALLAYRRLDGEPDWSRDRMSTMANRGGRATSRPNRCFSKSMTSCSAIRCRGKTCSGPRRRCWRSTASACN